MSIYEWAGKACNKQPMLLTLPDGKPFAFAGLWEIGDNQGKEPIPLTFLIVKKTRVSQSAKRGGANLKGAWIMSD